MKTKFLGASIAIAILSYAPARASIVQYTDATTFEAAAPITTTYNFSQIALGTYSTITVGPVSFSPNNTGPQPMDVLGPPNDNTYGQRFLTFFLATNLAALQFDISPFMANHQFVLTGFGVDFGYENTNLGDVSFSAAFVPYVPGCCFTQTLIPPTRGFIGFTDSQLSNSFFLNLETLDLTSHYGEQAIDLIDFSVQGHMSSAPEPSTWAMLLLGFAGIGFMAYRKAKPVLMAA
jgi:hypothetical protein